jgi:hypothetical protein
MGKGSYIRPSGDWFVRRMMSRNWYITTTSGQYTYLGVYNNATDGSNLYVVALRWNHATIMDTVFVGTIQGNPLVSPNPGATLNPIVAVGPGLMGGFTSATDLLAVRYGAGGAAAELGSHSDTSYDWPYNFPVAMVPPTWCVVLETHAQNQDLGATFWWYWAKE